MLDIISEVSYKKGKILVIKFVLLFSSRKHA
jgi:hypothetical protein